VRWRFYNKAQLVYKVTFYLITSHALENHKRFTAFFYRILELNYLIEENKNSIIWIVIWV